MNNFFFVCFRSIHNGTIIFACGMFVQKETPAFGADHQSYVYVSIKRRKHEKRDFQCKYHRANIYSMAFSMFRHGINFFLYWSVTNNFRIKYSMNKCTFCVCIGVSGPLYVCVCVCPVVFGRISPFEGCQYSLQMTCQWFW